MIPVSRPSIGKGEIDSVVKVLKTGMIAQGVKVRQFEGDFAKFVGAKHAVALNSGTAALHAALYAVGIKEGDEVITTPFTFIATANSILMQRATPVFVDIEEDTFNIDAKEIEEKITKKTKAILPVDLYGHPYDYEGIKKIANKYNLAIIEDACQAIGADCNKKKCGTLGDISAFSFYATKNMTTAEGGMLTTNNEKFAELARQLRHHGQDDKQRYEYFDIGYNYRLTDIMAAIGIEQLKKISSWNKKRISNAEFLSQRLSKIKGIKVPMTKHGCTHVFHQFTIVIGDDFKMDRNQLMGHLKSKGIGCAVYYPKPLHLFSHISKFGYKKGDFPVGEKLSQKVLSLPIHPQLTENELDAIAESFEEIK